MTDLNRVNFMSRERFNNLSSTNNDELYIVETDIVLDENVVHNTGNESISGNKTFNNNLSVTGTSTLNTLNVNNYSTFTREITANTDSSVSIKLTNINISSGVDSYKDIQGLDTEGNRVGGLRFQHTNGNIRQTVLYVGTETNSFAGGIYLKYNPDTESSELSTDIVPGTTNSTSYRNIATVGWVNDPTKSTNVVHKTGNESIAGTKTFSSNTFMLGSDDMCYGIKFNNADNSAETQGRTTLGSFRAFDKNDKIIGDVRFEKNTDGTTTSALLARNYANSEEEFGVNARIACSVTSEGEIFTYAPTPVTSDNSTQIATTAYVNAKIQFVNSLPANPINGVLYLIPES